MQSVSRFFVILASAWLLCAASCGANDTHLLIAEAVAPAEVTSGLVAWWKLDDGAGSSTAADASGNAFTASLVNIAPATAWVTGQAGGALRFDGVDDRVDLGNRSAYKLTSYTITGWVRATDESDYKVIASRETRYDNRTWWVAIERGTGRLMFRTSSGGSMDVNLTSNTDVADGAWHHFAAVLDGTSEARLYVDRTLKAVQTSPGVPDLPSASALLGFGTGSGKRHFKGTLDDLRVYGRALSAKEIESVYEVTGGDLQPRSPAISGIHPHLAVFGSTWGTGSYTLEVGIGAVVPWAGKLWYLTYPPHAKGASDDKLYELGPDLNPLVRPESVGGTHANRLIHTESNQLIIGPYLVDAQRNVRVVPRDLMPGRLTATMRHLNDPAKKVYFYGMEEEFYAVDVSTLAVQPIAKPDLSGRHAKGGYTSQGRVVVSNNGEKSGAGVLAEWDGKTWHQVHKTNFTEVTGPGGIRGAPSGSSPLWALGWDRRSAILKLLDGGKWHTLRLPRATHTYDAANGWNTEWPRIRDIGAAKLLMDAHGMFFAFPKAFAAGSAGGIRPIASHHKMVVDFTSWKGQLVMAANHASKWVNPFVGKPQSNLWFGSLAQLQQMGPRYGAGGPWLADAVAANTPSDPYLFAGFPQRIAHLRHDAALPVTFTIEIDAQGNGTWTAYDQVNVPAGGSKSYIFPKNVTGEWIRFSTDRAVNAATAYLRYGGPHPPMAKALLASLPTPSHAAPRSAGIVRPRDGTLQFAATAVGSNAKVTSSGYYEVDAKLRIRAVNSATADKELRTTFGIHGPDFKLDAASVIMTDGNGHRFRLPKGAAIFDQAWAEGWPRGVREVVTERSLMNIHGSFYELPRDNSGGLRRVKPVCTHNRLIHDFCSWRGLLVLSGNLADTTPDGHFVRSQDSKVGLWFGDVDDLWRFGPPRGRGGPWLNTAVAANAPSDPFLMAGYDKKSLTLAHDAAATVQFTVQVDVAGDGSWSTYRTFAVSPGQEFTHDFPQGYHAHWVRLRASQACTATAQLTYTTTTEDPGPSGDGGAGPGLDAGVDADASHGVDAASTGASGDSNKGPSNGSGADAGVRADDEPWGADPMHESALSGGCGITVERSGEPVLFLIALLLLPLGWIAWRKRHILGRTTN